MWFGQIPELASNMQKAILYINKKRYDYKLPQLSTNKILKITENFGYFVGLLLLVLTNIINT